MKIVEKYPLVEGGATCNMAFHQTDVYESVNNIANSHIFINSVSLTLNIIFERYLMKIVEKYPLVEGGATCNMAFHQTDVYESVNIIQCL